MIAISKQRGLSLLGCALLMALLSLGAMAALFSIRHERNLLAEIWARAMPAGTAASALQQTQGATGGAQPALRRCTVDGKVLYSNVDCGPAQAGSRAVKLHITQGLEAPKAPPAPAPERQLEEALPVLRPVMPAPAR